MSDLQPIEPEAAKDLYLDHRRNEVSDETLKSHRYRLGAFVDWCGQEDIYNLNDLTGRDLHTYRVYRREEHDLAPMTLQGQLSTLRVFLGFCASIDAVPEGLKEKVLLPSVRAVDQSRDRMLNHERVQPILNYLDRFKYASQQHVLFALLWNTGMRMGGARSIDLEHYHPEEKAVELHHRPNEDTPLKNGEHGERWVALSSELVDLLDDYIRHQRVDVEDEYGRKPLLTTKRGRISRTTIRNIVYRWTRPCVIGDPCPHDEDPDECDAANDGLPSQCPSTRSPHDIRTGAITAHLLDDVSVEIVSDRMNVSADILDQHYDQRSKKEKMKQRRKFLEEDDY